MFKKSFLALIVNGSGVFWGFVIQLILARVLTLQDFGDYYYVLTWINILMILTKLGLDNSSKKFLPQFVVSEDNGRFFGFLRFTRSYSIVWSLLVIVVLGLILLMIDIRSDLKRTYFIASGVLFFGTLLHIKASQLQAIKEYFWGLFPTNFIKPAIIAVVIGLLYLLSNQIDAVTVMTYNFIATIVTLIISYLLFNNKKPLAKTNEVKLVFENKLWFAVSLPLLLNSAIHIVLAQADVIVIGLFTNTENAGIYNTASKLAQFSAFGLMAVNIITAPLISENFSNGMMSRIQSILRKSSIISFLFSSFVMVLIIFYGKWVLNFFGEEFLEGETVLLILVVSYSINAWFGPTSNLLMMTKYHTESMYIILSASVINIILNIYLVYIVKLGILGAAIATAISMIYWNVFMYFFAKRKLRLDSSVFSIFLKNQKHEA